VAFGRRCSPSARRSACCARRDGDLRRPIAEGHTTEPFRRSSPSSPGDRARRVRGDPVAREGRPAAVQRHAGRLAPVSPTTQCRSVALARRSRTRGVSTWAGRARRGWRRRSALSLVVPECCILERRSGRQPRVQRDLCALRAGARRRRVPGARPWTASASTETSTWSGIGSCRGPASELSSRSRISCRS